jgi:hypothetical protein
MGRIINDNTRELRRDPDNPYNHNRRGVAMGNEPGLRAGAVAGPYDPESKGLDGDAIDALLKARMSEGMAIGHRRGVEEASSRYSGIHDDGYDTGVRSAEEWFRQNFFRQLQDTLLELDQFVERHGEKIPERQTNKRSEFARANAVIRTMLERLPGRAQLP